MSGSALTPIIAFRSLRQQQAQHLEFVGARRVDGSTSRRSSQLEAFTLRRSRATASATDVSAMVASRVLLHSASADTRARRAPARRTTGGNRGTAARRQRQRRGRAEREAHDAPGSSAEAALAGAAALVVEQARGRANVESCAPRAQSELVCPPRSSRPRGERAGNLPPPPRPHAAPSSGRGPPAGARARAAQGRCAPRVWMPLVLHEGAAARQRAVVRLARVGEQVARMLTSGISYCRHTAATMFSLSRAKQWDIPQLNGSSRRLGDFGRHPPATGTPGGAVPALACRTATCARSRR